MNKITILLLLCLPLLLSAQKKAGQALIDSLLKELPKAKEDTNKVILLNSISIAYYYIDPDEGLKYINPAFTLSGNLGYKNGIAWTYSTEGNIYYVKSNMPEAVKYHSAGLKLFEEIGNKKGIGASYNNIGNCYYYQGNYPEALKNYFVSLQLYEKIGDKNGMATCYANIGNINHFQDQDSEALLNYYTCGKIAEEIDDKYMLAQSLENMGNAYFSEAKFTDALKNDLAALSIFEEMKDKNGAATAYNFIGLVYEEQGKHEEAYKNALASVKLYGEIGNKFGLAEAYGDIGEIFLKQKKFTAAEKYFNGQRALGKEIGSLSEIKDANGFLSDVYAGMGKFKKSLESYKAFIEARDSMFNKENTKKMLQTQMQYDFDKKESQSKVEQAKKDAVLQLKLQRRNFVIYGTLSAFVVLLAIGTLLFRQNKLRANQQKTELEQKQLRAQMNPHFIFNCLNSIQHFIVANDVKNANKYLSGFALLMRQTLEHSKEGMITLRREIEYLENYLVLETMRFEDKFTYTIECAADVDNDTIEIPSMIIQPFVENAIRHGLCYLEGKPGRLDVSFFIKDNYLYCAVDDNGIGRARSHKLKIASDMVYESQGMELTRRRLALVSKSAHAEYKIEITDKQNAQQQPEGTVITIKFPLPS